MAEALLFEHEDGRYAVNPDTTGDPKWHRLGPVDVSALSTNAGEAAPVAWIDLQADEAVTSSRRASWPAHNQARYTVPAYAHPPAAVHGQGASTEAPAGWLDLQDDPRVNEIVSGLYRRFKDWSQRGFSAEDVTWCEVKADVIRLITATAPAAIPAAPATDERSAFDAVYEEQCGRPVTIRTIAWRCFQAGAALAHPAPVQHDEVRRMVFKLASHWADLRVRDIRKNENTPERRSAEDALFAYCISIPLDQSLTPPAVAAPAQAGETK
ncbi:hypothetical protein [Variovorax paradoxus]|uniref:hypothetical protein n=1 Tax=Variovorax paradoxus TaxID=34073 RepID=UPI00193362D5|nr:hypothetical protein INQ48_20670 [Variovorax paradoxus]